MHETKCKCNFENAQIIFLKADEYNCWNQTRLNDKAKKAKIEIIKNQKNQMILQD
jgi:hypothetical protein